MKPSGLTPAMLAEKLGEKWNEAKITAIIEGKEGISERSAKDLSAFFGTTSQFWDDLQQLYFQWAKHKREVEKGPIKEKKKRGKKG
ncbi:MAG: hypothetical protein HYZ48_02725 [Chlamydiales bacterium]|nr:hypothetical protein [Chlamydiales bacterium]